MLRKFFVEIMGRSVEFGPRQEERRGELRHISLILPRVVADIDLARRRAELERLRAAERDRKMFYHAVYNGPIPDKDALQEELIDPTVRRVVEPAVRAYETTLTSQGGFKRREARRVARRVGAKIEGVVFDAATVSSRERPNVFSELGRFVGTYLPTEALHSALRTLKLDFSNRGVTTPVRQEIFRSIARPRR